MTGGAQANIHAPPAPPSNMAIRLNGLDSSVMVISVIGALVLLSLKHRRKVTGALEQLFGDMCGIWTTIELVLISISTLQQDLLLKVGIHMPEPAEIIRNNGPLVPLSLLFCAALAARTTFVSSISAMRGNDGKKSTGAGEAA